MEESVENDIMSWQVILREGLIPVVPEDTDYDEACAACHGKGQEKVVVGDTLLACSFEVGLVDSTHDRGGGSKGGIASALLLVTPTHISTLSHTHKITHLSGVARHAGVHWRVGLTRRNTLFQHMKISGLDRLASERQVVN